MSALPRERRAELAAILEPLDPDEGRPRCRCRHNTSDPERGCECGYADWLCDEGIEQSELAEYFGANGY